MVTLKDQKQGLDLCGAVFDAINKSNLQWVPLP